jgi:hypothetical protein
MKNKLLIIIFLTASPSLFAQKKIDTLRQVAFVYYEDRKANLIVIPNIDKLYSFKIYRKAKTDTLFNQVAEMKRPPLAFPMRYYGTPYSIGWEDKEFHTRDVDYKVSSFDKSGNKICEVLVIWEKKSPKGTSNTKTKL